MFGMEKLRKRLQNISGSQTLDGERGWEHTGEWGRGRQNSTTQEKIWIRF